MKWRRLLRRVRPSPSRPGAASPAEAAKARHEVAAPPHAPHVVRAADGAAADPASSARAKLLRDDEAPVLDDEQLEALREELAQELERVARREREATR